MGVELSKSSVCWGSLRSEHTPAVSWFVGIVGDDEEDGGRDEERVLDAKMRGSCLLTNRVCYVTVPHRASSRWPPKQLLSAKKLVYV